MTRRARSPLPLLLPTLLALACKPPVGPAFPEADIQAIRQAEQTSLDAIRARNWQAWAQAFVEDGTILPPNGEAVRGRAAIQQWSEAYPPITDFQAAVVSLEGRQDLAYIHGTYSLTMTLPGAASFPDRGKYLSVWRKQADGSWKMSYDIFNSDLQPPPAPAKPT